MALAGSAAAGRGARGRRSRRVPAARRVPTLPARR
jgi:hypothetical protein